MVANRHRLNEMELAKTFVIRKASYSEPKAV